MNKEKYFVKFQLADTYGNGEIKKSEIEPVWFEKRFKTKEEAETFLKNMQKLVRLEKNPLGYVEGIIKKKVTINYYINETEQAFWDRLL